MTHFVGAVTIPADIPLVLSSSPTPYPTLYGKDALSIEAQGALDQYLSTVLAKFDENIEVVRWTPRSELIAAERAHIEAYRTGIFAEYQADQAGYTLKHEKNLDHIRYLQVEFPEKLAWTDQQCWEEATKFAEPEDIDSTGAMRETYNPDAKWDWWSIGGRWEQVFRDRQGETVADLLVKLRDTAARLAGGENLNPHRDDPLAHGGDLPWHFPYHLVTTDGQWLEIGEVGWWGTRNDAMTEAQWVDLAIKTLSAEDPNARVVYIDFHI